MTYTDKFEENAKSQITKTYILCPTGGVYAGKNIKNGHKVGKGLRQREQKRTKKSS
jgi:hypothetical protein